MKAIYKQIESYLTYCQKVRRMSEVTLRTKRYTLIRFADETGLRDLYKLSNYIFNQYIAKMVQNKTSGRSINTYSATIISFVKYYQELGLVIPFKPVLVQKQKEKKTERKFYTAKEIGRVIKAADQETGLIIEIMFETGMRIAEITKLKVTDFQGQKIQFIGKGRKLREVYIKKGTFEKVQDFIKNYKNQNSLWGKTLNGEPPTPSTIRKKLKRVFLKAGFKDFYPHALRHSFATNLQSKGASIAEIKEMMGHASIATTERYLHGFDGKLRELFEKYE